MRANAAATTFTWALPLWGRVAEGGEGSAPEHLHGWRAVTGAARRWGSAPGAAAIAIAICAAIVRTAAAPIAVFGSGGAMLPGVRLALGQRKLLAAGMRLAIRAIRAVGSAVGGLTRTHQPGDGAGRPWLARSRLLWAGGWPPLRPAHGGQQNSKGAALARLAHHRNLA